MKKRFSEEQIIGSLREAEAGMPIKDLCRQHGFSEASYYLRRSKFGGMIAPATRFTEPTANGSRIRHNSRNPGASWGGGLPHARELDDRMVKS